jgi:hypothetical protein
MAAALMAGPAFAQGVDYSRFQRSTLDALNADLAAVVAGGESRAPAKIGDTISGAPSSWVVEASYAGAVRAMSDDEKAFVRNSFRAVQQEPLAALYGQSMLFRVDRKDYWLPVRSDAIPYFTKELKAGDKVDLYVLQSGGLLQKDGWDWLFLVVDFQKTQAGPAKPNP